MEFTVQVEKTSSVQRKLLIKVPSGTVETRFKGSLAQVQRTADIKGFRKGHVPLPVIQKMYGEDLRHQLFHNLIEEFYGEAIRKERLRAIGSPKIETPDHKTGDGAHDHSLQEGKDLSFTATVEVVPEIEVKNYTGLALTKDKATLTDQDVETTIKGLQDSRAELVPVSGGLVGADGKPAGRPARKGDFVDMKFEGGIVTDNGIVKKDGMSGQRLIEIGSDQLIPGFEDNLVGLSSGDNKTFRVPFPADYPDAEIAGKEAEFSVSVHEIKEKKLPPLDDSFAKDLGYDSLDDMRSKAKTHLTAERQAEADRKLRSDLLAALIEKNPFEVPQSLVQAQTRALAQDVAQNLKQQGFNDQQIQEAIGGELPNLTKRAESQVRASLILEAVGRQEKIAVSADDISAEIKSMAENMKVEEERVREYYLSNPQRRDDFEYRLREDRTVKFLLDKAKIK